MGALTARDVVVVSFPFSDLSYSKLRPAVVLAYSGRDDWILCQITSKAYGDQRAVMIRDENFEIGALRLTSYARPGKLFTANSSIIRYQVGKLHKNVHSEIIAAIVELLYSDFTQETNQ